jgi:protein TonB
MSDLKTILPKIERPWEPEPERQMPQDRRQWKLMSASLLLLVLALAIVVWHDRDFWFPDQPDADSDESADVSPVSRPAPHPPFVASAKPAKKPKHLVAANKAPAAPALPPAPAPTTTTRTVLPPLEVEVIAGDTHSKVRPGSSSIRVDLQPGTPPQPADAGVASDNETAAHVTNNAAERVSISTDAAQIVSRPVQPAYPLLARQMKVQGSVILQALIGRDGIIQNLNVISGPQILASAAEDAVRQWHFKPHFQGNEPVETEAKITVNFTISTN